MTVGVPREIKKQEHRVALLPATAYQLTKRGHRVLVECGAGSGCGYPDEEYAAAGAELVATHEAVFAADLVVKVKEPQPAEIPLLRSGQVLFTYLHLAPDPEQTKLLLDSGCVAIAYETVTGSGNTPPPASGSR
jgi:alanine dehydrogenase